MSKKTQGWPGERQRHTMSARGVPSSKKKPVTKARKAKRAAIKGVTNTFFAVLGTEHSVKSTIKRAFPNFNKKDVDNTFKLFVDEGLLIKYHVAGDMYRYVPSKKFYAVLAKDLPESERLAFRKKAVDVLGGKAVVFFDV